MTCLWPMPDTEHLPADWGTLPSECKTVAQEMASRAMEFLTAGRVGVCPVTIQPVKRSHCEQHGMFYGMLGYSNIGVLNWNGTWSNTSCGCETRTCDLALPAPVGRVDEVKVDGQVLNTADYQVDNGNVLTWVGTGDCPWTTGQVEVTYLNALPPGPSGLFAMSVLAYEFGLACKGQDCRLPEGTTSIVRQGVSFSVVAASFPDGKTGLREVDSYTALYNPKGLHTAPQVWSPDLPSHRVIGG